MPAMNEKGVTRDSSYASGDSSSSATRAAALLGEDSGPSDGVLVNVFIPELKCQKRVLIDPDETLWVAKILFLSSLDKELRDGLNYGFYLPPASGRAGSFLDEERTLRDWPDVIAAPVGMLEFAHKRRLVRSAMSLNVRKLRQLHSQSQLRQFMELVRTAHMDKLLKYLNKGFDPNFQDPDTGETPMTQACMQEDASAVLLALVSNGAHLDFRSRQSLTPLHVAAIQGNVDAIKTLIELGASAESKDKKGLPPLYHVAATRTGSLQCAQLLLREHAMIGYRDENGYTELHQACKNGNVGVVDMLAFYGADLNAQSSGGGTALHLCVANNEMSCLKTLLMRGADPNVENLLRQVPLHVAIVMGYKEAADMLNKHGESALRPFTELPTYNLQRPRNAAFQTTVMARQLGPGSRRLSVSALQLHTSRDGCGPPLERRELLTRSCHVASSAGSVMGADDDDEGNSSSSDRWSLGTRSDLGHLSLYLPGHRRTAASEVDDVMSVSEDSFWAGRILDSEGRLPEKHMQGIVMRHKSSTAPRSGMSFRRQTLSELLQSGAVFSNSLDYACHTAEQARTVVLTRGKKGYGFVLRGAKADQLKALGEQFVPSERMPALQYLDSIDKGSIADKAGLKAGDFILEINGTSIVSMSHEEAVQMIKRSGDILALKVVTVSPLQPHQQVVIVSAPGSPRHQGLATNDAALLSPCNGVAVHRTTASVAMSEQCSSDGNQEVAEEAEAQVLATRPRSVSDEQPSRAGSSLSSVHSPSAPGLILSEGCGSVPPGKGSSFNTFKAPAPPKEIKHGVAGHRHYPQKSNTAAPLTSPDGIVFVDFSTERAVAVAQGMHAENCLPHGPAVSTANGGDAYDCNGNSNVPNHAEQVHSAPVIRRHMSQASLAHSAPIELHRSSSAVDVGVSVALDVSAAKNAVRAAEGFSGSQTSLESSSSSSSSSFAEAIKRAAAAVRAGSRLSVSSKTSSPTEEQQPQPLPAHSAAGQKPALPQRSSVPSIREGSESRALRPHQPSSGAASKETGGGGIAAAKRSSEAHSSSASTSLTDDSSVKGESDKQSNHLALTSAATNHQAAAAATPIAQLKSIAVCKPTATDGVSPPQPGRGASTSDGLQADAGADRPLSAGAVSAQRTVSSSRTDPGCNVRALSASTHSTSDSMHAHASKGARNNILDVAAGSCQQVSSSAAPTLAHPLRKDAAAPDAVTSQQTDCSRGVLAAPSGARKVPPLLPAKRVMVKTEHFHGDDTVLLPPPPMFHTAELPRDSSCSSERRADSASSRVSPKTTAQYQAVLPATDKGSSASCRSGSGSQWPISSSQHRTSEGTTVSLATSAAAAGGCCPTGASAVTAVSLVPSRSTPLEKQPHHERAAQPQHLADGGRQCSDDVKARRSVVGGRRPFTSKHVEMWTVEDVADWLDSVGLSEYRRTFVDNCIEGEALVNLTRSECKELGIDKVGHRVKFEREVLKLMAVSSV